MGFYKFTKITLTKTLTPLEQASELTQQVNNNTQTDNFNQAENQNITTQNQLSVNLNQDVQTQTESTNSVDVATQTEANLNSSINNLRNLYDEVYNNLRNNNNNNTQEYRDEVQSLLDLLPPLRNQILTSQDQDVNQTHLATQNTIENIPVQIDIADNLINMQKISEKLRGIEKLQQVIIDNLGHLSEYKLFWAFTMYLMAQMAYHIPPDILLREFRKYFMKFYRGIKITNLVSWFNGSIEPNVDFRYLIEKSMKSNTILEATMKALRKIIKKWF